MNLLQNELDVYELATAYVDNEATTEERKLIESNLQKNKELQRFIMSEKAIKSILVERLPVISAPDKLKSFCIEFVESSSKENSRNTAEQIVSSPINISWMSLAYRWAAAAVVVLGLIALLYQYMGQADEIFLVENHAHRHFVTTVSDISYLPLHEHSTHAAEEYLSAHFGINITVPTLDGAQFEGVVISEFVPGFETPLLSYSAADPSDLIMIFVFEIDKMYNKVYLKRDEDAVSTCVEHDDVHIKDIQGKHVVSWKWGDTWYTAVSHHDGEVLASMLPINR